MSGELTAADVRAALLWLADSDQWCANVARRAIDDYKIIDDLWWSIDQAARERATCAAEARAEGDR